MTDILYREGFLRIKQCGRMLKFRVCDLDHMSRSDLARAVSDIAPPQCAGEAGFLKTQSVDVRKDALEEILGASFPYEAQS